MAEENLGPKSFIFAAVQAIFIAALFAIGAALHFEERLKMVYDRDAFYCFFWWCFGCAWIGVSVHAFLHAPWKKWLNARLSKKVFDRFKHFKYRDAQSPGCPEFYYDLGLEKDFSTSEPKLTAPRCPSDGCKQAPLLHSAANGSAGLHCSICSTTYATRPPDAVAIQAAHELKAQIVDEFGGS